jgi:glycosyltransferase involved in cell wall biosynthesis
MPERPPVAFVQDHLVQRGGAERVLLSMAKAAPGAEIVTGFYWPEACYPEYRDQHIRTLALDRVAALRSRHRAALPLLPIAFSRTFVDADVVLCCTSGWAQGVRVTGRKVIYFHALARWLYERDAYLNGSGRLPRVAMTMLKRPLERWDRGTVATGDRYLTQSTAMQERLRTIYGIDAEIVPPPNTLDPDASHTRVEGLDAGFFLCASRLLPYKNVTVVVEAFTHLPHERLVVAGDGPLLERLRRDAGPNVVFLGACDDDQLRWLYSACRAVISAAVEPYGLTPVEAATFGRPSITIADGGFLDTVVDGETGLHFGAAEPAQVAEAVRRVGQTSFDTARIRAHAAKYAESRFVGRIRAIIAEERAH